MRLRRNCIILLTCAISICSLTLGVFAADKMSAQDNVAIEFEQGTARASKSFSIEIGAYTSADSSEVLSLDSGETVRIRATYSPENVSVDFGLIDSEGIFHYLNTKTGSIDQTFNITESGNYRLGIRNNSGQTIKVSGFVRY